MSAVTYHTGSAVYRKVLLYMVLMVVCVVACTMCVVAMLRHYGATTADFTTYYDYWFTLTCVVFGYVARRVLRMVWGTHG